MERRLAAILAADVVGYWRLMGEDEAGMLERLKALPAEAVDPVIAEHKGRIVKLMGDGGRGSIIWRIKILHLAADDIFGGPDHKS